MVIAKSTILIVEDDVDVADMLTAYFRVQGHDVLTANWGEEAVSVCSQDHPNLIILDIRLPDIDGYEVARRVRSNPRTCGIPIIFLTEKRDLSDRLEGLKLGADDYITKPFDIQELRLRVRNALRRASEGTLTNPVTGLAEGMLVDERLAECLGSNNWALLMVSLDHLDRFRESYGFVASDDVQRAVSLMIHNAVRDVGGSSDFIGQLGPVDFILVTTPGNLDALVERIRSRLNQSLDYFYPLNDRGQEKKSNNRLRIRMSHLLPSDGAFNDPGGLKLELLRRRA